MKVGVKEGDWIIKVNGIMVINSLYLEVVKLIKFGVYVVFIFLGFLFLFVGIFGF